MVAIMLACCLCLALCSCGDASVPIKAGERAVRAAVVSAAFLPDEVTGFGSLSFLKKVDVASPQDAVIRSLPYREGDTVRAGAIVALLYNPQIELAVGRAQNGVAQAQAALALARARLFEGESAAEARLLGVDKSRLEIIQARRELVESERKLSDQETLFAAGGVTKEAIRSGRFSLESARERIALMEKDIEIRLIGLRDEDLIAAGMTPSRDTLARKKAIVRLCVACLVAEESAAAARLDAAGKELESARLALAELTVRSPSGGVVGARYLEEGERAKREDKFVTIMDVGSLYAVAPIREADADRLFKGMRAIVTVDAVSESFDGIVDIVSPVADAQSASFIVRVLLQDIEGRLKPGMFARLTIAIGEPRRVLVVPESAVIDRAGDSGKALAISGGMIRERKLTLGESTERGQVVLSGVAEGDVIVDKPEYGLKEGDRVSVSD